MSTLILVEDDTALRDLLTTYLRDAGHQVTALGDGLEARSHIPDAPDLWVLDIMLPGMDGYTLLKEIKKATPHVPVLFASARSAELDRVIGLEMGSDDYLPKPFLPRELVLRVERILGTQRREAIPQEDTVALGSSRFHRSRRLIETDQEQHPLTNKEFDLLEYLLAHPDTAIKRNDILDAVWGTDYFGSDRVVDDTLRRLRKKAPELPVEPVYGYGYRLQGSADRHT